MPDPMLDRLLADPKVREALDEYQATDWRYFGATEMAESEGRIAAAFLAALAEGEEGLGLLDRLLGAAKRVARHEGAGVSFSLTEAQAEEINAQHRAKLAALRAERDEWQHRADVERKYGTRVATENIELQAENTTLRARVDELEQEGRTLGRGLVTARAILTTLALDTTLAEPVRQTAQHGLDWSPAPMSDGRLGTYECPKCGRATPHRHDEEAPDA